MRSIKDLRQHIVNAIDSISDDVDDEVRCLEDGKALAQVDIDRIINYYLQKESREKFTVEETQQILALVGTFYDRDADEDAVICKLLELEYGEEFESGIIRGSCQGDYLYYLAPASTTKEMMKWIEAVLFATGTEFMISCQPYATKEDFEDANDFYCDYTYLWRDEDIKKWVAGNIGCSVDEVKLLRISDSHTITTYDYEEV